MINEQKQELFDRVMRHLRTQGAGAIGLDGKGIKTCLYRASGGFKCAIGALIPDEMYSPRLEGKSADLDCVMLACGFEPSVEVGEFLRDLQQIHDRAAWATSEGFLARAEQEAQIYATRHNLRVPEVTVG